MLKCKTIIPQTIDLLWLKRHTCHHTKEFYFFMLLSNVYPYACMHCGPREMPSFCAGSGYQILTVCGVSWFWPEDWLVLICTAWSEKTCGLCCFTPIQQNEEELNPNSLTSFSLFLCFHENSKDASNIHQLLWMSKLKNFLKYFDEIHPEWWVNLLQEPPLF